MQLKSNVIRTECSYWMKTGSYKYEERIYPTLQDTHAKQQISRELLRNTLILAFWVKNGIFVHNLKVNTSDTEICFKHALHFLFSRVALQFPR